MADVKISALPASTTPLAGTEVLPIVQSATTRQVSVANLTAGRSVGGTNFIPSGSSVPTNGMYLPAANSLGFSTNSTNVATIDTSGNLGLGVTPSAWFAGAKVFEFGSKGNTLTSGSAVQILLTSNAFFDSSWKYGTTGAAAFYELNSGSHKWSIAASGTAGNPITFTQAMTLDASGNLGIGTTSPAQALVVSSTDTERTSINLANTSSGGGNFNIGAIGSAGWVGGSAGSLVIRDSNAGATRLIIDSSGIFTMGAYGAGAATFSAAGVISSVSDETWKIKDGVPTNTDAMLQKLEPGYWFYNEEKAPIFGEERQLGFYAQNVHEAIGEEAAPTPEEGKPWGYYDRSVLAVAVMSLKNALNTIEELKQRITALENK